MPFIAVSMGKVRYFSTSTGDSPGALVSTETCVLVTSGTASIDSLRAASHGRHRDQRPDDQHDAAAADRQLYDPFEHALPQQLALEQERSRHRDLLAFLAARNGPRSRSPPDIPGSTARFSKPSLFRTNTIGVPSTRWTAPLGTVNTGSTRVLAVADDARGDELVEPELALCVFSNSTRTWAVRVFSSMTGST